MKINAYSTRLEVVPSELHAIVDTVHEAAVEVIQNEKIFESPRAPHSSPIASALTVTEWSGELKPDHVLQVRERHETYEPLDAPFCVETCWDSVSLDLLLQTPKGSGCYGITRDDLPKAIRDKPAPGFSNVPLSSLCQLMGVDDSKKIIDRFYEMTSNGEASRIFTYRMLSFLKKPLLIRSSDKIEASGVVTKHLLIDHRPSFKKDDMLLLDLKITKNSKDQEQCELVYTDIVNGEWDRVLTTAKLEMLGKVALDHFDDLREHGSTRQQLQRKNQGGTNVPRKLRNRIA